MSLKAIEALSVTVNGHIHDQQLRGKDVTQQNDQ